NKLKHELGHAHMINHAIIPSVTIPYNQSIVYYCFTCTSAGGTNVSIKPSDIEGALQVFPNSQLILSTSCGTPLHTSSQCGELCSGINSISENEVTDEILVFPNPSGGKIFIQSVGDYFESGGNITLTNISGKHYF